MSGECGCGTAGQGPHPCDPELRFPRQIANVPALPHVRYRIGTYASIRERLLADLNLEPSLLAWTHREPDDPGIALLEGAAILGDILTFYQELYANEVFLRTSRWRESVASLVQLLGYRLAPGLAGVAAFALEIDGSAPIEVPAGFPFQVELADSDEPAMFETLAPFLADPRLSRFFLHRPLVEAPLSTGTRELRLLFAGDTVDVSVGDRLVIGRPDRGTPDVPERLMEPQVVVVDEVDELHGHVLITIEGSLRLEAPCAELVGFRIGRTFRHFGHNAPPREVRVKGWTSEEFTIQYSRSLTGFEATDIEPPIGALRLPLDGQVDDLTAGGLVVCTYREPGSFFNRPLARAAEDLADYVSGGLGGLHTAYLAMSSRGSPGGTGAGAGILTHRPDDVAIRLRMGFGPSHTVVRRIGAVAGESYRWGTLGGASTVLDLTTSLVDGTASSADIRTFQIHEVTSPLVRLRAAPVDRHEARGDRLLLRAASGTARALEGRRIMIRLASGASCERTVNAVEPGPPLPGLSGVTAVVLNEPVDYDEFSQRPDAPRGNVYGNVVDADQGKTVDETILGSGDRRQAFQTFRLPDDPLTYHFEAESTPPQVPSLDVYVAGRRWRRVESLYGQPADAEVYVVREDADGASYAQFGDGVRFGGRLPTGVDNVMARYRIGTGAFGPAKPETRIQAKRRLQGLAGTELVGIATGGAAAETADSARAAAPGRVQTLGRLVGLQDFEAEALGMPGVALARAAWALLEGIPSIVVTVLMEHGREGELGALRDSLEKSNSERGAGRHPIEVVGGAFREVYLEARFALQPGLVEDPLIGAIEHALGVIDETSTPENGAGLFSPGNRRFGEAEFASRIAGVIQAVPGVAWAQVDRLQLLEPGPEPPILATTTRLERLPCADTEVLRLSRRTGASPFRLTRVSSQAAGSDHG